MLAELWIENFALVGRLQVSFSPGFNVLTGETGAGKSLLVDAVELLLGGRALSDYIRTDEEKALVQGLFLLTPSGPVQELLSSFGLPEEEDHTLLLSREVSRTGRNLCRVNGRTTPLSLYQEIGRSLVEIHGQNAYQLLLTPAKQLFLLDSFGGPEVQALRQEVEKIFNRLQRVKEELAARCAREQEKSRQLDFLRYQTAEIEAAKLSPGEEEELEARRKVLAQAEKLAQGSEALYRLLFAGGSSPSAYDLLGQALKELGSLVTIDPWWEPLKQSLTEASCLVEEGAQEIRRYQAKISFEPELLAKIEERLELISRLKRKYKGSIAEILAFQEEAKASLAVLEKEEGEKKELEGEEAALRSVYEKECAALSLARQATAVTLETRVQAALAELFPGRVSFKVALRPRPVPGATGKEEVEFLFTANPGELLKPLAKVASGGEIARFALALKSVLAEADQTPTLIFDEVDAGIGGEILWAVAQKLANLGRRHQVICVTHSPQIASYADNHYQVEKKVEGGKVEVFIQPLETEMRVEELARMLAGRSEAALEHARQMLTWAQREKEGIKKAGGG